MARHSAGLLLYRRGVGGLEVLIAHPGGPIWSAKDAGVWTIPKGEPLPGESSRETARREFAEETGHAAPGTVEAMLSLGRVVQLAGKVVSAYAVEGDLDPASLVSNTFEMVWPPRSGRLQRFPEIDRLEWVGSERAARQLNQAQVVFVERLADRLAAGD